MKQNIFRGQRINKEEFVYGNLITGVGHKKGKMYILPITKSLPPDCDALDGYEVIPETIGQYVRTDMQYGIETTFYEGDIVMLNKPYNDKQLKAEIYYDEFSCAFRAKIYEDNGIFIDWLTVLNITKVLGNIYENPELLKN